MLTTFTSTTTSTTTTEEEEEEEEGQEEEARITNRERWSRQDQVGCFNRSPFFLVQSSNFLFQATRSIVTLCTLRRLSCSPIMHPPLTTAGRTTRHTTRFQISLDFLQHEWVKFLMSIPQDHLFLDDVGAVIVEAQARSSSSSSSSDDDDKASSAVVGTREGKVLKKRSGNYCNLDQDIEKYVTVCICLQDRRRRKTTTNMWRRRIRDLI